jgi:regulator of replication initiation timing
MSTLARKLDGDFSFAEMGIFANRKIRSMPRESLEEVLPKIYRDGFETRQLFFGYRRANDSWPGSRTTVSLD